MPKPRPDHPGSEFWSQVRVHHFPLPEGSSGAFVSKDGEVVPLEALDVPNREDAVTLVFLRFRKPAGPGEVEAMAAALDKWVEENMDRDRHKFLILDHNITVERALVMLSEGRTAPDPEKGDPDD